MISSSFPKASIVYPRSAGHSAARQHQNFGTAQIERRLQVQPQSGGGGSANRVHLGKSALAGSKVVNNQAFRWPNTSAFPGWTQTDIARARAIASQLSPPDLVSNVNLRYGTRDVVIAHRGLVDNSRLIPESSMEAVQNAVDNGINNVEVDVQSTSDGHAVPLHDNTLTRITGGAMNSLVSDTPFSAINGKNMWIKNPSINGSPESYTQTPSTIQGLQPYLTAVLQKNPHLSITLDPKSVQSAMAVATVLGHNPWMLNRVIMKPCDETFWPGSSLNTSGQLIAEAFTKACFGKYPTSDLKVDPVSVCPQSDFLSPANLAAAKEYVDRTVHAYSGFFEVPQVEIANAYTPGWSNLKNALLQEWANEPERSTFVNNPHSGALDKPSIPNIGTFYRYEDYEARGHFYAWQMDGTAKEDLKPAGKRTPGSYAFVGGWLTSDVPLQEVLALASGMRFGEGNRAVDF